MPFYAVAHGFIPNIYEDWNEAKKQIDKFPQPVYKKFETKEDAEEYFKERRPTEVVEDYPEEGSTETFYAVARGKNVGVFADYETVKESIDGYPQPLHKKFSTLQEAVAYYEKFAKGTANDSEESKAKPKEIKPKEAKKTEKPAAYYAVARGHQTGVFLTWDECKQQTTDFKGAKFKKFDNEDDAKLFAEGKTLKQIEESRKRGAGDAEPSPPKKSKK